MSEKHFSALQTELFPFEDCVKKLSFLNFKYSGWSSAASESDISVSMAAISSSERYKERPR